MNPNLPRSTALVVLAGRLFATLMALGALLSKPLEPALFSCAVLGATWFVVEMGINLRHQHLEAVARKVRDDELKRQRAEEARLRFEIAQSEIQRACEGEPSELDPSEEPSASGARIPLESLMKKGVAEVDSSAKMEGEQAPSTASGMSALDFDMALMRMDAESKVGALRRA